MNYWWANHKQTFKEELEGGYIWSPQVNSNSSKNQTYLNLKGTKVGDIVFSYANSEIKDQLEEEFIQESIGIEDISETEKQQLVKSRRGQGVFRKRVEEQEIRCRVTGVENPSFLIASHIKPWKMCSNAERLDGDNGLLLSPHVDRLFDRGWISFPNSGDVVCFNEEVKEVMKSWNISHVTNVETFSENQIPYLEFHRAEIFKGTNKES